MEGLTEGRVLHYVLKGDEPFLREDCKGQHRPALVVSADEDLKRRGLCNLVVFVDGYNDLRMDNQPGADINSLPSMVIWIPNVKFRHPDEGGTTGTWHWPRDCQ